MGICPFFKNVASKLPFIHVCDVLQEVLKQLIKRTVFRWTVGETMESGCDMTREGP